LYPEEQHHIRRYGKEYSPLLDGVPLEMRKIENRLQSFFREIELQGGDYPRAFKRFDRMGTEDGRITYQEYKAMVERWNGESFKSIYLPN
jgi:hypothetical protein